MFHGSENGASLNKLKKPDFRIKFIWFFFGTLLLLLVSKLFYLQVIDKNYKVESSEVSIAERVAIPARGMIYDRNDSLIVYNAPVYDVYFTLNKLKNTDTSALCDFLEIDTTFLEERIAKAREAGFYVKPYPLVRNLPQEDFAMILEDIYKFPVLSIETSTERRYNYPNAALLLGYMGEVDDEDISNSDSYYAMGDYMGKSGMESTYEDSLRGIKGKQYVLRDKSNLLHGSFKDGELDVKAIPGKDLLTTLDINLQAYGEQLMQNKVGSVVAIEPASGEILAMISTPSFNPNWLTGRNRNKYFKALLSDTLKPMFNRAIQAVYPPGSTFKPLASLIALEWGAVDSTFSYPCNGGYNRNRGKPGCHAHAKLSNVSDAIKSSCNAYYAENFRRSLTMDRFNGDVRKALDEWHKYVRYFGYDTELNIGVGGVKPGHFPSSEYYDNIYKGWNWKPMTVISLSIGQGETLASTLQMANTMSAIANRGYFYTPHLVKKFSDGSVVEEAIKKNEIPIKRDYFDVVIDGMERVFIDGTAASQKIEGISACGKTGTAENPHGKDHSIFVAFAPKDNPQIAIAVIVENSGFGSTYAAPVASLMIEKYIKDSIPEDRQFWEQRMFDADLTERKDREYLEIIKEQQESIKRRKEDLLASTANQN